MKFLSPTKLKAQQGYELPEPTEEWRSLIFILLNDNEDDNVYICLKRNSNYEWIKFNPPFTWDELEGGV